MRKKYLDGLRGLAIILMVITHSYRLKAGDSFISLDNVFNFFMDIEPFTSALFLFLSGFSMFYFIKNNGDEKKLVKKSLFLIFASFSLCLMQNGLYLKLLLSSGVLWTIAISMILIFYLHKKEDLLWLVFLLILTFEMICYVFNLNIIGYNFGFNPISPLLNFAIVGYFMAKYDTNKNWAILFLMGFVCFFIPLPWTYDQSMFLSPIIKMNNFSRFDFYNHSLKGFFSQFLFISLFFNLFKKINFKFLNTLGRHSLFIYIYHLIFLELIKIYNGYIEESSFILVIIFLIISPINSIFSFIDKRNNVNN